MNSSMQSSVFYTHWGQQSKHLNSGSINNLPYPFSMDSLDILKMKYGLYCCFWDTKKCCIYKFQAERKLLHSRLWGFEIF